MDINKEEALKAKQYAEKRFAVKDYAGAKSYALKARSLLPELDGISQMVTTFDIYMASESKINGEVDFYSVLGLKPSADRSVVKKQYRKLAVLLHPDKNKTVGADGAFKLVSEAWTLLSDVAKRASYDLKRNSGLSYTCGKSAIPPTFWTVCTSCQVQYEYLRKYVNKRLSCKNCRATFVAVELGTAPINGSYPVCSWSSSYAPDNGYGGHGYNGVSYFSSPMYVQGNGVPGYHSGHGTEYVSNVSFQWGTCPGTSAGYVDLNGYATVGTTYPVNGTAVVKTTRPYKRRKLVLGAVSANGNDGGTKVFLEEGINGMGSNTTSPKFCGPSEPSIRQHPVASTLDARSLLIERARTGILKKLEELKKSEMPGGVIGKFCGARRKANPGVADLQPQRSGPVTLVVPDSDFHDFDKDRAEECFKPKQIWALYDEEDGMPRLYCQIRQVISLKPFKIHISYLSSKSDKEFGSVNWIQSGFTKSCGSFRAFTNDVIEQVNMFSHLLSREKAGRGGCVRIFPRSGDIWAIYRNWSPNWNRSTPCEERHQYEMVEVVDDYSEELGVCVTPLIKLAGFKTVYCRNTDKHSIQWIPKREVLRFSHQIPSRLLKEENDLPEGCWDLDPAATPQDLLQAMEEVKVEEKHSEAENLKLV